jgi:hypothetical protein
MFFESHSLKLSRIVKTVKVVGKSCKVGKSGQVCRVKRPSRKVSPVCQAELLSLAVELGCQVWLSSLAVKFGC